MSGPACCFPRSGGPQAGERPWLAVTDVHETVRSPGRPSPLPTTWTPPSVSAARPSSLSHSDPSSLTGGQRVQCNARQEPVSNPDLTFQEPEGSD